MSLIYILQNILKRKYNQIRGVLNKYKSQISIFIVLVVIVFLTPCLISSRRDFTNELEEVTLEQETEEVTLEQETEEELIKEPITEKTYENTSLLNTPSNDFEVLSNFNILDSNNIITVKEKINDYSEQPTFSPGQFN